MFLFGHNVCGLKQSLPSRGIGRFASLQDSSGPIVTGGTPVISRPGCCRHENSFGEEVAENPNVNLSGQTTEGETQLGRHLVQQSSRTSCKVATLPRQEEI